MLLTMSWIKKTCSRAAVILLLVPFVGYRSLSAQIPDYSQVSGKIIDSDTKKPLIFASINIKTINISNVSNGEGIFSLKFPAAASGDSLVISYIGYRTKTVAIRDLTDSAKLPVIALDAYTVRIPAVVIKPLNALTLINEALAKIPENYPDRAMQMTGFYREMIRRGNTYVSLTEAVLDIYKASYSNTLRVDQAGIYKGRGSVDWHRIDTLFVKFRGGISSAMEIDVAKWPFLGTNLTEIGHDYIFKMDAPVQIGNRLHHVVSFNQARPEDIKYRGKIYIDARSLAIGRIEFNMNIEDRDEATGIFIRRKPAALRAKVLYATYMVQYKPLENKRWIFDYSRSEIKFESKWKKKWFKNYYTVTSELAVTDHSDKEYRIPVDKRVRSYDITLDKVQNFRDDDFWEDYNVIEPEAGIEQVIARIIRQLEKRAAEAK